MLDWLSSVREEGLDWEESSRLGDEEGPGPEPGSKPAWQRLEEHRERRWLRDQLADWEDEREDGSPARGART